MVRYQLCLSSRDGCLLDFKSVVELGGLVVWRKALHDHSAWALNGDGSVMGVVVALWAGFLTILRQADVIVPFPFCCIRIYHLIFGVMHDHFAILTAYSAGLDQHFALSTLLAHNNTLPRSLDRLKVHSAFRPCFVLWSLRR